MVMPFRFVKIVDKMVYLLFHYSMSIAKPISLRKCNFIQIEKFSPVDLLIYRNKFERIDDRKKSIPKTICKQMTKSKSAKKGEQQNQKRKQLKRNNI